MGETLLWEGETDELECSLSCAFKRSFQFNPRPFFNNNNNNYCKVLRNLLSIYSLPKDSTFISMFMWSLSEIQRFYLFIFTYMLPFTDGKATPRRSEGSYWATRITDFLTSKMKTTLTFWWVLLLLPEVTSICQRKTVSLQNNSIQTDSKWKRHIFSTVWTSGGRTLEHESFSHCILIYHDDMSKWVSCSLFVGPIFVLLKMFKTKSKQSNWEKMVSLPPAQRSVNCSPIVASNNSFQTAD